MAKANYDDQLVVLIGDIYRHWRMAIDAQCKDQKLTRTEWHILGKLDCRGPSLTQLALCHYMGMDAAQLARALNSLEKKGYIKRAIDQKDRRLRHITLSAASKPFIQRINKINDHINRVILDAMTPAAQKKLQQSLAQMREITHTLATTLTEKTMIDE